MLSKLQRWNLAIDEIRAATIFAENEDSTEAKACRRHYPQVISEMLVGKDFSIATRRRVLTETTNDRETDWLYAYTIPGDVASIQKIIPDLESLGLGIPVPVPGEPYMEIWSAPMGIEAPYVIAGNVLYTNAANATAEFSINTLEGIATSPLVDRAITLELAARLAVPVKGDRDLKRELVGQARVAWEEAVADDRNRQPESYGGYMTTMELGRAGYSA